MGIFGKKTPSGRGMPTAEELHFGFTPPAQSAENTRASSGATAEEHAPKARTPIDYGIDEAIKLVRKLPRKDMDETVVASIIKQTLASVDVYLSDIIEDAGRKEGEINEESRRIEENIAELTANMEALKQDLVVLQGQLDETIAVRNFLRKALDQKLNESYEASRSYEVDSGEAQDDHPIEGEHLSRTDKTNFDIEGTSKTRDQDSRPIGSTSSFRGNARATENALRKPRWDTASIYGISDAEGSKPQS